MIFHWQRFKKSLKVAIGGIGFAIRKEENFRLMFLAALIAIVLSFVFPLKTAERALVFLTITIVLGMELINAQIEKVLNFLQPNLDKRVKIIKDLSAGAVLITAIGALVVGLVIFLPKIIGLLK
ncbi:diacylglycerol kinase family protein [bacterium]|nr:diacylglycerol kinase family protein [bacterium]